MPSAAPKWAFALRENITVDGASSALPDGTLLDVHERLTNAAPGPYVTSDEQVANALRSHAAVKEVSVPDEKSSGSSKSSSSKGA